MAGQVHVSARGAAMPGLGATSPQRVSRVPLSDEEYALQLAREEEAAAERASVAAAAAHADGASLRRREEYEEMFSERARSRQAAQVQRSFGTDGATRRALRLFDGGMDVDRMSYEELLQLGERIGRARRAGPTLAQIQALPTRQASASECGVGAGDVEVAKSKASTCTVCCEVYQPRDELRTLPCFHTYHARCIDRWLTGDMPGARKCPVCHAEVVTY
mmetsp:Transcript_67504/g.173867  ORF Transcript_67504/g.173867 Transcript_67504/m.173867 type:complete len:219 (+) Transcript_67504:1-657(+)